MKYNRYGKFNFFDYTSGWFAIVFFAILGITSFLLDEGFPFWFFPLIFSVFMTWSIYKPNSESFLISGDTITIMQGRKKQKVSIPSEPTLIVSYADVCPPLAKRISYGNQTYMLKGRYAISILQKIPLETALARLHQNHTRKYTASTVEECFEDYLYVYSFVGNEDVLGELVSGRKCQMIVPETLVDKMSVDFNQMYVHIDVGY